MMRDAQRILRELRKAKQTNNDELFITTQADDIRHCIAEIKGPDGTPFEGHYFQIDLQIPQGYPIDPPIAKFLTPIFHPNIKFKQGEICLDILKAEWTPAWGIQTLCTAVQLLLSEPVPDSPLNTLAGNLLRYHDEVGYRSMASMYARKYAHKKNELMEKAKAEQQ